MIFGKEKSYYDVKFSINTLEAAVEEFNKCIIAEGEEISRTYATYYKNKEDVMVNNADKGIIRDCFGTSWFTYTIYVKNSEKNLRISCRKSDFTVTIQGFGSHSIPDQIIRILNDQEEISRIPTAEALKNVKIFIGHGRSRLWRDLKDHLQDHHGLCVIAYETGARGGFNIQEVLTEMSTEANIAFLVHTAEDIDQNGVMHARENVIHETGLFQGKIGFRRAIVVQEEGTNEFSNIAGLQQVRFSKGNIREIFGDILAILKREFSHGKK
ncbi:TIR domain-containing protein [Methylorubrum extorquens]